MDNDKVQGYVCKQFLHKIQLHLCVEISKKKKLGRSRLKNLGARRVCPSAVAVTRKLALMRN